MTRIRLIIILGVVLGLTLLGAFSAFFMVGSGGDGLSGGEPFQLLESAYPATATPTSLINQNSEVIVALQSIARGAEFLAGSVGRRAWPANNMPPDVIGEETELFGKVAKVEIIQGQPIIRSLLVDKGSSVGEASLAISPLPTSEFGYDAAVINYAAQAQERRVIIYRGEISLVVEDTQEAVTAITNLATDMGGYVSESSTYHAGNNVLQGNITIRVPSNLYQETLAELRALALRVELEESRSQDVTEEFIDQEARLANLKAGEEAMQALLDGRQQLDGIGDIAEVQQKLAEIRGDIEQTEGRLRYLTDQAFLSTIRIGLIPELSPPTPTPTPTPLPGWAAQNTVNDASQSLVFASQRALDSLIWGVIFGLPLLIIYLIPIVIVVWVLRWGWRRYKTGKDMLPPAQSAK